MNFSINTKMIAPITAESEILSTAYFAPEVVEALQVLPQLEKDNVARMIRMELSAGDAYRLEERLASALNMDVGTVCQFCSKAQDTFRDNKALNKAGVAKIFTRKYFSDKVLDVLNQMPAKDKIEVADWFHVRLSTGDAFRLVDKVAKVLNVDTNEANRLLLVARDAYFARIAE